MNIKRRFQGAVTAAACLFLAVPCALSKTIYVDSSATGANNGKNWPNAYLYLQDALADASALHKPGEICVAQGVYRPDQGARQMAGDTGASFNLLDGAALMGGYAGAGGDDPNMRDIEAFPSILSGDLKDDDGPDFANYGDNSQVVVTSLHNDNTATIDGFTVIGGIGWSGPGISCYDSNAVVTNCTISKNKSIGREGGWGGGMYISGGGPTLIRCTFAHNTAEMQGGGMWNQSHSRPTLIQCKFIGNRSIDKGGAIRSVESELTLTECIFEGNESYHGGAIDSGYQNHLSVNACVFRGNVAAKGGAIFTTQSQALLTNCLFSDNRAVVLADPGYGVQSRGGAIYVEWSSDVTVVNCTCVANFAAEGNALACEASGSAYTSEVLLSGCILAPLSDQEIFSIGGSELTVQYTNGAGVWPGVGNMDIDPCFVDPGHWADPCDTPDLTGDDIWVDGDYHLKSQAGGYDVGTDWWFHDDVTSPCIDAGDPLSPIGHEPFPNGGIVNMGAYGGAVQASKSYFGYPPCETIVAGDINGDCRVDFKDFNLMALHWSEDCLPLIDPLPCVSITAPQDGAGIGILHQGDPITIEADAVDIDGAVVRVEFFVDGSEVGVDIGKVGEDTSGSDGWMMDWIWWGRWGHHPEGYYSLTAKATDDNGATTTSASVRIRIAGPK